MSLPEAPRCRHIKVSGALCGSPALRNKTFCFYHQERPLTVPCYYEQDYPLGEINLPLFEDAHSVQSVIRQVVQMVMQKRLERKTASLLLYALQIASSNLKRMDLERPQPEQCAVNVETTPETDLSRAETEHPAPENLALPRSGEQTGQETKKETGEQPAEENGGTLLPGTIQACSSDPIADCSANRQEAAEVETEEEKKNLRSSENRFPRRTDVLKPAADVDLRVRLTAEMASRRTIRALQVPPQHGKFFFSALDHKPMRRMVANDPANLTLKFP